jgi:hypothetical protein
VEWFGNTIPLRNPRDLSNQDFQDLSNCFLIQTDDEAMGEDWMDSYVTQILDAKYKKLDIDDFVSQQTHLTEAQRQDLRHLLKQHEKLFDGTLGVYPHKKMHLELLEDAKPHMLVRTQYHEYILRPLKRSSITSLQSEFWNVQSSVSGLHRL